MPFTYTRVALKAGAAMLLGIASLAGTASAQEVAVTHPKGETVVAATPTKVAVFDLATLDIINALGVDAVAGVPKGASEAGNFPPHLAKYSEARYSSVGTLFEPDTAALTALKPDLIFIAGRSASKYDATKAIAPTIDMSPAGKGLAETAIENTRTLGRVFGVSDRAEQRIAAFEAQLATLHAEAAKQGTGLLLFAAGQGAVVHAPGDRFGTLYDFVGIRSAVPAAAPAPAVATPRPAAGSPAAEAAKVEREKALTAALATDPNWIFVIDRTAVSSVPPTTIQQRLGADTRITATKAWQAGRVIYLDPRSWYIVGAGIDALSQSATDILAAFKASNP